MGSRSWPAESWPSQAADIIIWQCNINGWITHNTELVALIRMADPKPTMICLNETKLDPSVHNVVLEGYSVVARMDREANRGGGIMIWAQDEHFMNVTLTHHSEAAERAWAVVHTDFGPLVVGAWYRPPRSGEIDTIRTLRDEWRSQRECCVGGKS